jgi:hypothetical protein
VTYTDAVTGQAVTGQTITGKWWGYPSQAVLDLNASAPGVVITNGAVTTVSVAQAVLNLAASFPATRQKVTVSEAVLDLAASLPTLKLSVKLAAPQARLNLIAGSATILFAGQVWLWPSDVEDFNLVAADCSTVPLVPLTCR